MCKNIHWNGQVIDTCKELSKAISERKIVWRKGVGKQERKGNLRTPTCLCPVDMQKTARTVGVDLYTDQMDWYWGEDAKRQREYDEARVASTDGDG